MKKGRSLLLLLEDIEDQLNSEEIDDKLEWITINSIKIPIDSIKLSIENDSLIYTLFKNEKDNNHITFKDCYKSIKTLYKQYGNIEINKILIKINNFQYCITKGLTPDLKIYDNNCGLWFS